MYSNIILPLDGSEYAERALPVALRLLSDGEGPRNLHIIRVLEFGIGWTSNSVILAQEEGKKIAEDYLAGLALGERAPGTRITTEVHTGPSPAQVIADYAEKIQADLIVMTCHGRSGLSQFFVGSQTERTLRLAKCSILVVR